MFHVSYFFFQSRQPIFVQLLSAAFRVAQCQWLTFEQRTSVENCIQTLSEVAKSRGIAVPNDLDIQVSHMFSKAAIITRSTAKWMQKKRGMNREVSTNSVRLVYFLKTNLCNSDGIQSKIVTDSKKKNICWKQII